MKFEKLMELHADDLVYRTITAFEAPSSVVTTDFERSFVTPQAFPVYVLDRTQILPGYMALLTTWPAFHEEMSTRCVGTVLRRKTLSKGAFESIPIALPPVGEQRRIVDLIGAVDDAVEAADDEADSAAQLRMELLAQHFAGADRRAPLGSLAKMRLGKMLSKVQNTGDDAPYLRNSNVRWGSLDLRDLKTMPFTAADRVEFRLLRGDVLVCEGGEIGRAAVLDEDLEGIFFQKALHRIRCNHDLVPLYLQAYFEYAVPRGELDDFVSGSTIKHLTGEKLARVQIPVVPVDEQERITAEVAAIHASAEAARTTAEALRTLRSNLLTVLLGGEHEIPSSYDQFLNLDEGTAA